VPPMSGAEPGLQDRPVHQDHPRAGAGVDEGPLRCSGNALYRGRHRNRQALCLVTPGLMPAPAAGAIYFSVPDKDLGRKGLEYFRGRPRLFGEFWLRLLGPTRAFLVVDPGGATFAGALLCLGLSGKKRFVSSSLIGVLYF